VIAWLKWALVRIGYVIRPYDMLADRRRWFWQPRLRCGWSRSLGRGDSGSKETPGGEPR
jgi:hypothetical protein